VSGTKHCDKTSNVPIFASRLHPQLDLDRTVLGIPDPLDGHVTSHCIRFSFFELEDDLFVAFAQFNQVPLISRLENSHDIANQRDLAISTVRTTFRVAPDGSINASIPVTAPRM